MRAQDILDHFLSRADWVDRRTTVDRIIIGDPQVDVGECSVVWMPGLQALKAVMARGHRLVICHEPTFWNHRDDRPNAEWNAGPKLKAIEEGGLTIVRNHDCWDRWPECGIPWAWGRFLGLGPLPAAMTDSRYQHRYDIPATSLRDFASRVAFRTQSLGLSRLQVNGDLDQAVSAIGIGTGCACGVRDAMELGCDCCIVCDDGNAYWRDVQYARDHGVAVICVHHGTSEEPGMMTMAQYINQHLDGLVAMHLPQGAPYHIVGPNGPEQEQEEKYP